MIDERSARRAEFAEGVRARLADGQEWSLPLRDPARDDPEYDAQLLAVCEAEDLAETLLAEFALSIFLLERNYDLSQHDLAALFQFPSGSSSLAEFQRLVHAVAVESFRRGRDSRGPRLLDAPSRGAPARRPTPAARSWASRWLGWN